jgi:hypothetical protein
LQLFLHFIRQVAVVIIREKKNNKAPEIIAPIILVAAKVMPSKMMEVKTVPRMPVKKVLRKSQQCPLPITEVNNVIPRNPMAIPSNTHKNAGVTVITAVYLKTAVMMPIIMLIKTEIPVQLIVQSQSFLFIISPPLYNML